MRMATENVRNGDTDKAIEMKVCVELLSSRLSIDILLLNTYSASGRRTAHPATTSSSSSSVYFRNTKHDNVRKYRTEQ